MSYLRKLVSGLLVLCMVLSMVPAVSADEAEPRDGRIMLNGLSLSADSTVWVDGVAYGVQESGGSFYLDLPQDADPVSLVTYSYHVGDPEDIHTQYPLSMNVWTLEENTDGSYTPVSVPELENILQYSGSSIRITGVKGIRMITSVDRSKKAALTSEEGLQGYKLLEYGTAVAWASALADGSPMILGRDYVKSNYAFKAGEEDPVFKIEGNMQQYTNVLVNFTLDECAEDIAMRPYMILQTPSGEQMTVYGGIVTRSIGYIAWQNRDAFPKGSAAYNYVWEIIRHVYRDSYNVTFDSNGGSPMDVQAVTPGSAASYPGMPTRDGYIFAGWYLDKDEQDLTNQYDFSTPVEDDLTLYALWIDAGLDTDGDLLPDALEPYFGTDPNNPDTDGDGLTDYQEFVILGTDPTVEDSDGNGISDYDEDADSDGLANGEEFLLGTDPVCPDSDFDGLKDGEEIDRGTDPNKPDTDDDGAEDTWEIDNGFSPVVYNASFEVTATSGASNVSASVTTDVSGDLAASVEVTALVDHPLLNSAMPGYVDVPFEFTVDGSAQNISATISFTMNSPTARIAVMEPAVYRYDSNTQRLEELSTSLSGNTASAAVTKCGTYILLDKRAFDEVWENEIKPPIGNGTATISHIDVAFVIDCSGSMSSYNRLTTAKAALHTFIAALGEKDRAALIKFNTSATVVSELTSDKQYVDEKINSIRAGGNTSMYTGFQEALNMLSDPQEDYGYKMIIILSDGEDVPSTSYSSKYAPLVELAKENGIVVYTIGAGTRVSTAILTQVANETGGAYYTATVTDGITDAFDKIQEDTVDLVQDSDDDGIPDYYEEKLTNGVGKALNLDPQDPDCDGDGLLDGEEVKIIVAADGTVYGEVLTDPWSPNTDGDGYSDYEEVKVFYSDPLDKNIVFMNTDTDFITEDENFVSDKYLDFYENKWYGWMERVCVWLGNRVFAANYDDVYLYKAILMQYLEDMTAATAAATENSEWLKTGFNIAKGIKGNIDNIMDVVDDGSRAEDLKRLKELQKSVAEYENKLKNFSPSDLNKAGYTSEQIKDMSNELFDEYIKTSEQIPELNTKVEFDTKLTKTSKAIGVVFVVVDVVVEGYEVYDKYNQFAAKITEMDNCLNALQLIIDSSESNKNLKAAAQELYDAIEAEKVDNMDLLSDVLIQTGGKITNELVWTGLTAIPVVGQYLAVVKLVLDLADFMFNMGDVAEQCACLYAISKSSTILAKDFNSTISFGYKVGSWTIIYGDYAAAADDYFALAVMRGTSENQMKKADKANSFLIEWLFAEIMYKIDDIEANLDKLNGIKYNYVVPGGC